VAGLISAPRTGSGGDDTKFFAGFVLVLGGTVVLARTFVRRRDIAIS
jgi:hypothetical protein